MTMHTTRTPAATCPECGYLFDAATGLGHARTPDEGAVSLCLACGALGIYTRVLGALTVRPTTPAEHDDLIADPRIRQALAVRARTIGDDLRPTPEGPTS